MRKVARMLEGMDESSVIDSPDRQFYFRELFRLQRELVKLLRRVTTELPDKDIWCYTGFVYEKDLAEGGRKHCEVVDEMLSYLDVLVDGPFMEEKKNIRLRFRGSSNQRVLNMKETLKQKKAVNYID